MKHLELLSSPLALKVATICFPIGFLYREEPCDSCQLGFLGARSLSEFWRFLAVANTLVPNIDSKNFLIYSSGSSLQSGCLAWTKYFPPQPCLGITQHVFFFQDQRGDGWWRGAGWCRGEPLEVRTRSESLKWSLQVSLLGTY